MDIAATSMVMQQYKVQQAASVTMMKKTMDIARQSSSQILEMLAGSPPAVNNPADIGKNIDTYV
jgi:hypothetical protein